MSDHLEMRAAIADELPFPPADCTFLTRAEFDGLLEYSTTLPTGQRIGKRWKARRVGGWLIGEYTPDPKGQPGYVGIRWTVAFVDGRRAR